MKISFGEASPQLRHFIKYYYLLDYPAHHAVGSLERITPDGCVELNFMLERGSILRSDEDHKGLPLPQCYFVSRFSKAYQLQRNGDVMMFGVCLYPWTARLLGVGPLHQVADSPVGFDEITNKGLSALGERILNASDWKSAIAHFETYFSALISNGEANIDTAVVFAAQTIMSASGKVSLKHLSKITSLSERRFQQRFADAIGTGPILYCRLFRFQKALRQMLREPSCSLTHVALEHHYFDQSHFIKDFRFFTGLSPLQYTKEAHHFNDLVCQHSGR